MVVLSQGGRCPVFQAGCADAALVVLEHLGFVIDARIAVHHPVQSLGDARIEYVRNPVNLGVSKNYLACVDRMQGEYSMLLGCDDRLLPGFLARGKAASNGDMDLAIAIRTAVIDADGRGEIGVGGGIVADSTAGDEYREALLKMAFFTDPARPVTLIETLLWERAAGFALLDRHLDRMADSAGYFGLPFDRAAVAALLESQSFPADRMRVRLTLDASGPAVTSVPLPPNPPVFRFAIAPEPLDSQSLWLAHKTTNRAFYDEPRVSAHAEFGVDEVVFLNERGELTEGSITNLFVERGGMLLTPPLSSGLLPGTLRAELLASGRATEQVLTLADLDAADAIWLGNSVRGLMRAEWIRT